MVHKSRRGPAPDAPSDRDSAALPYAALLAMAAVAFLVIVTETLPAGLLTEISGDLGVSSAAAGQLVSAYAAGTVLVAIPATALTRALPRRVVVLSGTLGFVVANGMTALVGSYELVVVARVIAGGFSGLLWGMLAGYARAIAPEGRAGRALALAQLGVPLALALGTPFGTWLGGAAGWRVTFAAISGAGVLIAMWVFLACPPRPGQPGRSQRPVREVGRLPGVAPILLVVFLWMLAHNLLYTYIAPFLKYAEAPLGTDVALLIIGVSAVAGIALTGALVDRRLRALTLTSITTFAVVGTGLLLAASIPGVLVASLVAWGIAFGGAATQLQTALAGASGADTDVANSMLVTAFNAAIFGGAAIGGLLLSGFGAGAFPVGYLVLALAALAGVSFARRSAFPVRPATT